MRYNDVIKINRHEISIDMPVYFVADIASNHDGDLERAKELICLAKDAGADAVKFQHFLANKIVSDYGFKKLDGKVGHQASWGKSVYEVYKECECHRDWNQKLAEAAQKVEIDFLTTPYDVDAVTEIDQYVPAYKIGSGDITWTEFIEYIAKKNKPVFLATGASELQDVQRAVGSILKYNRDIVLMQCNTNYTGSLENLKYVNLNVLKTFAIMYPNMILGLSDHTPGHATVLGAVALGARVVEKHFTSDNSRLGPDHAFSMNPATWKEMVLRSRELEAALGDGYKKIEKNENDTVILQQRCVRMAHSMKVGSVLSKDDIECLRPAPRGTVLPYQLQDIIGKKLIMAKESGQAVYLTDFE